MDEIISTKGIRVSFIIVAALLALFLLAKSIGAFKMLSVIGHETPPVNTIAVGGKGEVLAAPDLATFSFGVTANAASVADAQSAATKVINAAVAYLKSMGVAEKDIKTVNYGITPLYTYAKSATPVYYPSDTSRAITGYEINQTIEVKLRKISDAGAVLAHIGTLGVTNASGLTFTVDKEDELRKQARTKAIEDARADAENLARALGVRIVRVVNFSENGNYPMYYSKSAMAADGRGGASAPTPEVPSGENTITSQVSVTYEVR